MSAQPRPTESQPRRLGVHLALRALLHPIASPFTNAVALAGTIRNSAMLLDGRWGRYLNCRASYALTMLFYWTQAIQLRRHGRRGTSATLGSGAFPLTRWWHLTLPSTYAFHALGIAGVIGAILLWWLSHLLWLETAAPLLVGATMLLAALSSIFFAQAFVTQNYNAFGWMLLPAALWGLLMGHPAAAALAWFAASFASLTTIAVGCILSAAFTLETGSFLPVLLIVPAALKIGIQIFWVLSRDAGGGLVSLLKAIGLSDRGVRYKHRRARLLDRAFVYTTFLLALFTAACLWVSAPGRWMMTALLIAWVVNHKFARFADSQSFHISSLSVATAVVLASGELWLLIPYWLLVNPFPSMVGATVAGADPLRLKALHPFDVEPVLAAVCGFFAPVSAGERVLFAFPDPDGEHSALFDGYRYVMESALHAGTVGGFHVVPDWYFVYQYNFPGAPDCWAATPVEAAAQADVWGAHYIVLTGIETVPPGFAAAGSQLDWSSVISAEEERPWGDGAPPLWTLFARTDPPPRGSGERKQSH